MSQSATTSNVYYLPARAPEAPVRRPARKTTWRARLTRTWWRLRLTTAEIWNITRRGSRHLSFEDDGPVFLGGNAEIFERPRARRTEPARVLDFASARTRLRPASVLFLSGRSRRRMHGAADGRARSRPRGLPSD